MSEAEPEHKTVDSDSDSDPDSDYINNPLTEQPIHHPSQGRFAMHSQGPPDAG